MRFKAILILTLLAISLASSYEVEWNHSIGYFGNIPTAFVGFNITGYRATSVGYHLDLKTNMGGRSGRDNYYKNISVGEFDGPLKADSKSYLIFDVGITRKLFSGLHVMGGVGLVLYDEYLKYKDPMGILGDSNDEYWISDDEKSEMRVNLTAALTYIFKTKGSQGFSLTIGGDFDPPGVITGIGIVF